MGDNFVPRGTNFVPRGEICPPEDKFVPHGRILSRTYPATPRSHIRGQNCSFLYSEWIWCQKNFWVYDWSITFRKFQLGTNLSPGGEFCPLIFQWFRGAISTNEIVPFYLPNGFIVRKLRTWDQFCVPGDKICPLEDKICPPGDKFVPRIFDRKSAYPVTKLHFWSKCDQNDDNNVNF